MPKKIKRISVDSITYRKIKGLSYAGDSINDVLERALKELEKTIEANAYRTKLDSRELYFTHFGRRQYYSELGVISSLSWAFCSILYYLGYNVC